MWSLGGIPTHCSAVEEWDEEGITDVKDVAKASQLEDAGDGSPVYKHGKNMRETLLLLEDRSLLVSLHLC